MGDCIFLKKGGDIKKGEKADEKRKAVLILLSALPGIFPSTFLQPVNGSKNLILN